MGPVMKSAKCILLIVNTIFVMCEAQCPASTILNPPETARTYGPGTTIFDSLLDSPTAWCHNAPVNGADGSGNANSWMTIDFTTERQISGVVVQGRGNGPPLHPRRIQILYSSDGLTYVDAGSYEIDAIEIAHTHRKVSVLLPQSVKARFLMIRLLRFWWMACMRVAALGPCACGVGLTGPAGGPCTACPANTYKSASDLVCRACPSGTLSLTGSNSVGLCICIGIYRYIQAHIPTYIDIYIPTSIDIYTYSYTPPRIYTHVPTCISADNKNTTW